MSFLSILNGRAAATIQPDFRVADIPSTPAALPSVAGLSVPFRRLKPVAAVPSDNSGPDPLPITIQPESSMPAPIPSINFAIPKQKPAPPPARFITRRQ